ncbi:hypothetical protein HPB49_018024 [Dermacentor silvarum]|uniref:Uncharacterized protein n=1 Tax=Dermacentor silvarum TaxID=543639 RepID=A0ACB8C4U9_DERSI|nr:hypothetical protein HPB49_018024 [Dermacentor silvarum]
MDSMNTSIGWVSRLPWELQPRPLIGDSPELVPEPFRGLLLSERYPSEQPPCLYARGSPHPLSPPPRAGGLPEGSSCRISPPGPARRSCAV